MAATAEAISLDRLMGAGPELVELLGDAATVASLASFAGLGRSAIVAAPFVVGAISGAIQPSFTASADKPTGGQIGLLGPVSVRLSLQRLCTVTIQTDSGQATQEVPAIGGPKRPSDWYPFSTQASVTVTNQSSNFYVAGLIHFPVYYLDLQLAERIRTAIRRAAR